MITHRNAAMNTIGTLLHLPIAVGDRYLWTLPMFHANGWTFTWTVTAAGGTHVCLRKVEPATVFPLIRDEHVAAAVRGADRADLAGQRAGARRAATCARRGARDHRGRAAGRRDHRAARGRVRLGRSPTSTG